MRRKRRANYRTFRRTYNKLRVFRVIHRWTQDEMGRKLGYPSKYRYWELENDRRIPTFKERAQLAKIFKVSEAELFPMLVAA